MTTSSVEITGGVEWTVEIAEESGDVTTVSLGYGGPAGPPGEKGDKGDPGDAGTGGAVDSVVAGTGIAVDNTDASNPVISNTGATAAQGALADSAVQPDDLGTAATADTTDFATAAQGALADSATQPGDLGTAAAADTTDFATAAQGALADSATQPGDLATVATTGAYSDLTGTPTIPDSADDIGAVPTTRTVNSKALAADITLTASDVSAVPTTRTVNSKALSANITLSASDVGAAATTHTHAESDVTNLTTDLAAKAPLASPALTGNPTAPTPTAGDNDTSIATTAFVTNAVAKQKEVLIFALSDETTAITTGLKLTVRMPFAMTLSEVRGSLTTASSSGNPAVNIKESGTSIFSTTLTIDATELTSTTAATAAVISDANLADDAEMTFFVDTAGTGAKGLKVTLIGTRA